MKTILIMSGKGGVGKTTVSIGISKALVKAHKVGIYDADLMCPNGPRMLGLDDDCRVGVDDEKYFPVEFNGLRVFSTGFMLPLDAVMTLEGDRRSALLKDFTERLVWGNIDYLIVDLPPGTGDENLAVIESIPDIVGAVLVVTGKNESLDDARRVLMMLDDVSRDVPVIGVVRNMAYIDCPQCGTQISLFDDNNDIEDVLENRIIGSLPYKELGPNDFDEIVMKIEEFCDIFDKED